MAKKAAKVKAPAPVDHDEDELEEGPLGAAPDAPVDNDPDALAAALEGMGPLEDEDDEDDEDSVPDADLSAAGGVPLSPAEVEPEIRDREPVPTNATIARELSAFKRYTGDAQHLVIYFQDEIGKHNRINQYHAREIEPYGSVENFVQKVLVRKYGPGTYPIVGLSANGKEYTLKPVSIAVPVENEREFSAMDMQAKLLDQTTHLQRELLDEARARAAAPATDPLALMERFEEMKRRGSGDPMMLMMLTMMQQKPANEPLLQLVEKMSARMERLEERMSAPPPPPLDVGPDKTHELLIEMIRANNTKASPLDDMLKYKSLFTPPASETEKLLTSVLPAILAHQPSPIKEVIEYMTLLKKIAPGGDDNPLVGLLRDLIKSPMGQKLGEGLGEAMRNATAKPGQQPRAVPANASQPAAPPDFPDGYLAQYTARLESAKDDFEYVQAIVDALLALHADERWKQLPLSFLNATCTDDLAQVNQLLFGFFDIWRKKGATVDKAKTDAAIRAISTGWDELVRNVCSRAGQPIPETLTQRVRAATANAPAPTAAPTSPAPTVGADVIPITRASEPHAEPVP